MERFKVQSVSCDYKVFEKHGVVIAKAKFCFMNSKFTCTGKAQTDEWHFVEETGKKLARARAEKEAYIKARAIAKMCKKKLNSISDKLDNTINHLNSCVDHQKEYIKDF